MATGLAFRQLALAFRISKTAVSNIVIDVCITIWNALKNKHMSTPTVGDFENFIIDGIFHTVSEVWMENILE